MDARDWRFPTACPGCSAIAGNPIRVSDVRGTVEICVRCQECGSEWQLSADTPTLIRPTKRGCRASS